MANIIIISLPRSGSSMLAGLVASAGYSLKLSPSSQFLSSSEFNTDGYHEEVALTLLNDQIIRIKWGENASNLYIPRVAVSNTRDLTQLSQNFTFDLDERSVYIPEGFIEKVKDFTGATWDVWGISRMQPGGKWHKAYSRHSLATGKDILLKIHEYSRMLNLNASRLVIKDPRFGLTLKHFELNPSRNKIIHITRDPETVKKSMQRHFGHRMFTEDFLPGSKSLVSNHFNYRIGHQCFDEYWNVYNSEILSNISGYQVLEVRHEKIVDGSHLRPLEEFLEGKVDRQLIKTR